MDYLNNNDDSIAIRKYLKKRNELFEQQRMEYLQQQRDPFDDVYDNIGCWILVIGSICCFIPWSIISILTGFVFLSGWTEFDVHFMWISIILLVLSAMSIIILLIIFFLYISFM
eukprot:248140_1